MTNKNDYKSRFLHFIFKSPSLLKVAHWFNRQVCNKVGVRIAAVGNLDVWVVENSWPGRLLYYERLLRLVENVQGNIVECGVFQGISLIMFAILNRNSSIKRHIWGFDSFEGLPAPSREDLSRPTARARKGLCQPTSEATVWSNLRDAGFNEHDIGNQVTLIKGWLSDTLPKYDGSIALLHLDADLYDSTKCALENLWPKVAIGGIATFDEYHKPEEWPGEKKLLMNTLVGI